MSKIIATILLSALMWKIWVNMYADTIHLTVRKGRRINNPIIPIICGSLQAGMIIHFLLNIWTKGG